MATEGSAERPDIPASRHRPGSGAAFGSCAPENEAEKCSEGQFGGTTPCGHPACPLRRAGSEDRLLRRSEPERSGSRRGRRDCDTRKEFFVSPAVLPKGCDASSVPSGKHKLLEDREEVKRRNTLSYRDDEDPVSLKRRSVKGGGGGCAVLSQGVLSDSENEEPIGWRIRNMSAFVRKSKPLTAFSGGAQRSQSCTDPVEDRGGKLRVGGQPALMGRVGISHSYTAGILLSSENSRSVSAPVTTPDRKLACRAPLTLPLPRPERSISPESNDSISEELNHFKPIVCSPCTPPKRLPDGRLMQPIIVKSTPRNLSRSLQKATSYEASPAVLQKWMQIELDRQSLKLNSKATSPINELHNRTDGDGVKTHQSPAGRDSDGVTAANKRRLLFEPSASETDIFQKQSVRIRVPAVRYSSEAALRQGAGFESSFGSPESCAGTVFLSRKQSFSPYTRSSGFQSCKLVPKDSQSDSSLRNQSTSRRGKKREQKTKHLDPDRDPDLKRSHPVSQEAFDEHYVGKIQQEHQDRVLAMKLQKQFDQENLDSRRHRDTYFLRSWISSQNRKRRGLRRSRRISKKH